MPGMPGVPFIPGLPALPRGPVRPATKGTFHSEDYTSLSKNVVHVMNSAYLIPM